jgi:3',5'-nucleoside bisphosphate phosphatase
VQPQGIAEILNPLFKQFRSDLHVHTVLSPCAEVEMIPPLIVELALDKKINLIAITDHNSSLNFAAVKKAAENTPLKVLPGVELQTREEVHILCLFDTLAQIAEFQEVIDTRLPELKNQPEHFGEQFVVDETGEFIKHEEKLLLTSTALSMKEAFNVVEKLGGLFIPAHVNRKAFGLLENLGFVPTDIPIPAVEISRHITPEQAYQQFPQLKGYPIIQDGDVHRLDEFLGVLTFTLMEPSIAEIKLALNNSLGRSYTISTPNNTI